MARNLYKLMAYKDEYEVARLYSNGDFDRKVRAAFDGDYTVRYHLAPPLFAKRDADGRLLKAEYGSWMKPAMRVLAGLRFLRGTRLDPFGRSVERRTERELIDRYVSSVRSVLPRLDGDTVELAVELASLPERIRGFGHVKEKSLPPVLERWAALEAELADPAVGEGVRRAA